MSNKKKKPLIVYIIGIIVAIAGWYMNNKDTLGDGGKVEVSSKGDVRFDPSGLTEVKVKNSEYTVLEGCQLSEHRYNDGDSFFVKHPQGKTELRLYFVDTAESRLHSKNGDRIAEQGEYLGGLSMDQTVKVGKLGKAITMGLLEGKKFKVITKWEKVINRPDETRMHAFIVIEQDDKEYYLHEILAKAGLVRTKTRGAPLPDGTSFFDQRDKVRALEAQAKRNKKGAWGM